MHNMEFPHFLIVLKKMKSQGIFYPEKAKELGIPEGKMWQEVTKWKFCRN